LLFLKCIKDYRTTPEQSLLGSKSSHHSSLEILSSDHSIIRKSFHALNTSEYLLRQRVLLWIISSLLQSSQVSSTQQRPAQFLFGTHYFFSGWGISTPGRYSLFVNLPQSNLREHHTTIMKPKKSHSLATANRLPNRCIE
jgi:hypothetical protein